MTKKEKSGRSSTETYRQRIADAVVRILRTKPEGMRFTNLATKVSEELPDIPPSTVNPYVSEVDRHASEDVYKPARGLFRLVEFQDEEACEPIPSKQSLEESVFYEPFADWLVSELDECTKAIPLGGNKFKGRWGTPDVIGIRELRGIIQAPTEIVSAEIKTDTGSLITAFGQACSYKLFSHKCYVVVPRNAPEDDVARLDSLCLLFGLGLVLFDAGNADTPAFEIRGRALKHEPDMFYVNKYIKLIDEKLFG